jgi:hypothetical protein
MNVIKPDRGHTLVASSVEDETVGRVQCVGCRVQGAGCSV